MKTILWCITGGGAHLRDTVKVFHEVKTRFNVKITLCFSEWGFRVSRIYGVIPLLRRIASGDYMEEWLVGSEGFYYMGRVNTGRYDLIVIAPTTSNSIAKMVHGIADTLPTLVFSEALKSGLHVIILPTDLPNRDGWLVSESPCYVDRSLCECINEQGYCPASEHCPMEAIRVIDGKPKIILELCIGCGLCVSKCRYGAIKCWEEIRIKPRKEDLVNIEKLSQIGAIIVSNPRELYSKIIESLGLR